MLTVANSAAVVIAAIALLISPVSVSAAKRSALVTPSAVKLTSSSSSTSSTSSIQQNSTASTAGVGSCRPTPAASLEAAELHPAFMSPVGQVLIACRQLALLVEDVVYVTDHVVKRSRLVPSSKQLGMKCRWLQQLLGSRIHVRMLVLFAVVGLVGCFGMFLLGLLAPWASQHAGAAPVLGLLIAQGMLTRMPARHACLRGGACAELSTA